MQTEGKSIFNFLLSVVLYIVFPYVLFGQAASGQTTSEQTIYSDPNSAATYTIELTDVVSSIEWEKLNFELEFDLRWNNSTELAYQMPQIGRNFLDSKKRSIITDFTKFVLFNDNTSIIDYAIENDLALVFLRFLFENTITINSTPSKNLMGFTEKIRVPVAQAFYDILLPQYRVLSLPTVLNPLKNDSEYTAVVFHLADKTPIVSSNEAMTFMPKLFPTVYSKRGTLIYTPQYVKENTVPYTYLKDPSLTELGATPYIVFPLQLDSERNGNPIISQKDADEIMSNASLRKNIREGKVFFWIAETSSKFKLELSNE